MPNIAVANHGSYLDIFVLMSQMNPSFVAKHEVINIPIIGTVAKAMQSVFVDRTDAASRANTFEMMKRRACTPGFPPLLVFPEGTTTNGTSLIQFQQGNIRSISIE